MKQEDKVHFTDTQTILFQSLKVTTTDDLKNVHTYAKKVVQDKLVGGAQKHERKTVHG
jgi:hypothetical protein